MSAAAAEPAPEMFTPTGAVLGAWPANTDGWYAARRAGIGGSDVPPIVGYDSHKTALHVWLDKRGELPYEELGEAGEWGNLLEDVVAREWARRRGVTVFRVPTLHHLEQPWMLANLDRGVDGCAAGLPEWLAGCALEVKTRNAYVAGTWREDVPDDVLAQTQWQLMVTGLPHIHVACLIGGQRLVEHTVYPDEAVQAYVLAEASAVWQAVLDGVPPRVDASALLIDLLDRLHPNRAGAVEVDPAWFAAVRADYEFGLAVENRGKARKERAKAELVAALGGGDHFVVPVGDEGTRTVATYTPDMRTGVDGDRLKAEFPDAHKACVRKKPTKPVLRFKGAKS